MKTKQMLFFVLTLLLTLGLIGPVAAQDARLVNVAWQQEPDTLNPLYTNMWFAATIHDLLLAPAWSIDDQGAPVPVLVTEIPSSENGGVSEDGTTITLNLRDDITWSDGEPITSADFVFTYEMIISEANAPSSRYPWDSQVASVEAPDEQTVVVTFNEPFAAWWTAVFSVTTPPLPEHVLRPVFDADGTIDEAEWNRAPTVTSGPFVFTEWEVGSHMLVSRNDNYFDGAPKLDGVFFQFIPEDATVVASLVSGDMDMATFIPAGDTPPLEETGNITISLVASGYKESWFFNVSEETAHPAMLDVNVRRALALAFDRQRIVDDLLLGTTFLVGSLWQGTPYASPNVQPYPYDPDEAARLLDEAGWTDSDGDGVRDQDGTPLELRFVTSDRQIRQDVQVVVQQDFAELGITLNLETYPSDIYFGSFADGGPIATGNYDIAEWSTTVDGFPDPQIDDFLCSEIPTEEYPSGSNWNFYCNEELDSLFSEQSRTTDVDARIELIHQFDEMLTDAVIWIGGWDDSDLWAINNRVVDTRLSGTDPFWNAVNWDVSS
jgi:peptide/nickel transport system substrate-binding protein